MIIKVIIDGKPIEIDCDTGIQDIAWLSLSACYVYGSEAYPLTTFIPIIAKNKDNIILHPKLVIIKNLNLIGNEIYVKARKKYGAIGYELNDEEKEWYDNAFLEGRFKMYVHIVMRPAMELRKDNDIKLEFSHKISPAVALFFPDYPKEIEVVLIETGKRNDVYEQDIKIPFGELKPLRIIYCDKGSDLWDKETNDLIKNDIKFTIVPLVLTQNEKEDHLRKKEIMIRDKEIKIKEEIMQSEKEKKEEELRMIRLKEIMSNIPYSLEEVYIDIKDRLEMNEQDLMEVFNLLEEEDYLIYRRLFSIFSDYSQFFPIDETNDLVYIDLIAMHHFVKHYLAERPNLEELTEDFQKLYQMSFEEEAIQITLKEFIFAIVTLLKNLIYKEIDVIEEIKEISATYEKKLGDPVYLAMYKNKEIAEIIIDHHAKLNEVFAKYSVKILGNMEISPDNFLKLISEISLKHKCDLIKTINEKIKLYKPIDYFEFIEKLICVGLSLEQESSNESNNEENEVNNQLDQPIEKHERTDVEKIELLIQYVESLLE